MGHHKIMLHWERKRVIIWKSITGHWLVFERLLHIIIVMMFRGFGIFLLYFEYFKALGTDKLLEFGLLDLSVVHKALRMLIF